MEVYNCTDLLYYYTVSTVGLCPPLGRGKVRC